MGSETARSELEDIASTVTEYYQKLWVSQAERRIAPTVPNFNKERIRSLKNQLGLPQHVVQRKIKNVIRQLKYELLK